MSVILALCSLGVRSIDNLQNSTPLLFITISPALILVGRKGCCSQSQFSLDQNRTTPGHVASSFHGVERHTAIALALTPAHKYSVFQFTSCAFWTMGGWKPEEKGKTCKLYLKRHQNSIENCLKKERDEQSQCGSIISSRRRGRGEVRWHELKGIGAKWSIPSCSLLIGCHHRMWGPIFSVLAGLRGALTSQGVNCCIFQPLCFLFTQHLAWKKSCWNKAKITATQVAKECSGPFAFPVSEVTGLDTVWGDGGWI